MKVSGKHSIILLTVFVLFWIGASAILEVACLGAIGSVLILLQYTYYSRIIKRKKREKFLLEKMIKKPDGPIEINSNERIKIFKIIKKFVDANADDVESVLLYRYYNGSASAGIMLVYEGYYCLENSNINEIMKGYHDILFTEYAKLDKREIHFISATEGRIYASHRSSIYGKDYVAVFIISAKSAMEEKDLELKVKKLKRNFIVRIISLD